MVACDVADAAAAGVVGEHKALVAVETASEDTQQDAACGSGPLGPCRLGATGQAAPLYLMKKIDMLVLCGIMWKPC